MSRSLPLADAFAQAVGHHQAGRLAEAGELYRAILAAEPGHADSHFNLGVLALQMERPDQSLPHFRQALEADLSRGQFWLSYIDALIRAGDPAGAREVIAEGRKLGLAGPEADALATRIAAMEVRPDPFAEAVAAHRAGRYAEAEAAYRRLLADRPDDTSILTNLGAVLFALGRNDDAESCCRHAIAIAPDQPEAHNNLGCLLRRLGRLDGIEPLFRRAIELRPDFVEALSNLGSLLCDCGRTEEAVQAFRHALAIDPGHADANRNLMTALLYLPDWTAGDLFAEHRAFEARVAPPRHAQIEPHGNDRTPGRRLRIGYMSADFHAHSVARNLLPVMRDHDHDRFDIRCYAEVARPDALTRDFMALADGWRSTVGLSDLDAARIIRQDGIDILVCLGGRFDSNRLLVCASKPAPVQVSFHDVATSGLAAMDYLIADPVLVPRHSAERFTERVLRLPHFYLGEIPADAPKVKGRDGPVVFGCLNNPAKINDRVLDLWAGVLRDTPGSRLLLKYFAAYEVEAIRGRVLAAMRRNGVAPDRIDFKVGTDPQGRHLDIYGEIDITLDPFPFSGSTTTFESLIMGVPVVTLRTGFMVGNWSASMLVGLGLGDLIAETSGDYHAIARRLASEPERRRDLRAGLRARVASSPLCDHRGRTRQIERLYRAIWRRWCNTA